MTAETPEELFPLLARTGQNSDSLWGQQLDLLREYVNKVSARDLAVELPTGTGKTLTGLMIADWRRRHYEARAVFACPTVQLVRQVVEAAKREGIPVVDLSGSSRSWNPSAKADYERGRATAVVAYSAIFNSSPKLIDADVIIFDDAHAAEQYVAAAYTVSIDRNKHPAIHGDVVQALSPVLSGERVHQLTMNAPGVGTRRLVDAVPVALNEEVALALTRALDAFVALGPGDKEAHNQGFHYSTIRDHLTATTVFVSWDSIEIRPVTPPTFENSLFSGANQRVYLSATLGTAGEIERAFGRPKIKRLSRPKSAATPKSGRRFLVFPYLVPGVDPADFTKVLLAKAARAIVITPSEHAARDAKTTLLPEGWTIFGKDDIEASFNSFAKKRDAAVVLANRYDGIDLPGDDCRVVVLSGFPRGTNLQEQFLSSRARSESVLDERLRSRIVQGTGRCTRGANDWALVIIADPETTTYFSKREVQRTFDVDLQAEVLFGLNQSENSADDVRTNVDAFLSQSELWRDEAEPQLTEVRSDIEPTQILSVDGAFAKAAEYEVIGLERSWHGDWAGASTAYSSAASELDAERSARGYSATLMFRAAVFADKAYRETRQEMYAEMADGLAERAVTTASPATWMNAFLPFTGRQPMVESAAFAAAVARLDAAVMASVSTQKHSRLIESLFGGLAAIDHADYEPALSTLGTLIGADAKKPEGDGRTDSSWCWGDSIWLTLEAKSEHSEDGRIGINDVRQVNGHLALLSQDRAAPIPPTSAAVMITPRLTVKREALTVASTNAYRAVPEELRGLAHDVERLWAVLRTLRNVTDPSSRRQAIVNALRSAHLAPEDVFDRLTRIGLSGG